MKWFKLLESRLVPLASVKSQFKISPGLVGRLWRKNVLLYYCKCYFCCWVVLLMLLFLLILLLFLLKLPLILLLLLKIKVNFRTTIVNGFIDLFLLSVR